MFGKKSVKEYLEDLETNKLDPSLGIRWHDKQRINNLESLISALTSLYQHTTETKLKKAISYLLIKLNKILDAYKSSNAKELARFESDQDFSVERINAEIKFIVNNSNQEVVVEIKDPTHTTVGNFLARHFAKIIKIAVPKAAEDNITVLDYIIDKGGFNNLMYESMHQPDSKISAPVYNKTFQEARKIFPNVPDDKLEDEFQDYLFKEVPKALVGTLFQYSESMSRQQNMGFLWIRANHTQDFGDPISERRIYINIKLEKAQEAVKFIAEQVSDFLNKNNQLAPYIYFKFKIRVKITESDRADTCVCYLKLRKGIESYSSQIIDAILKRLASVPKRHINQMSSPVLLQLKEGVTTVDDNVRTDSGESYTSQIGKIFYRNLLKHKGKNPRTITEFQLIANEVIKDTINDLISRGYQI